MRQHKRTLGAVLQQKNLAGEKSLRGSPQGHRFQHFLFLLFLSLFLFPVSAHQPSCVCGVTGCCFVCILLGGGPHLRCCVLRFHFSPFVSLPSLWQVQTLVCMQQESIILFFHCSYSHTLSLSAASCRLLISCSDTHGKTCNLTHISDISCVPHSISTVGIHKYSGLHLVCGALLLTWLMLFQSAHCHFTLTRLVTSFSSHGLKSCDCKRLLETVERHRSVGILWLASRCQLKTASMPTMFCHFLRGTCDICWCKQCKVLLEFFCGKVSPSQRAAARVANFHSEK